MSTNDAATAQETGTTGVWNKAIWLPLVFVLLKFAGITLSTDQDIAYGDRLAGVNESGGPPAEKLFAYIAGVLLFAFVVRHFKVVVRGFSQFPLVTFLPVLALVSVVWSEDPAETLRKAIWLLLSVAFIFVLLDRFSEREILELVMLTGLLSAILSIAVVFLFPDVGRDSQHDLSWQGVFTSKNHLGRIALFFLTAGIHYPVKNLTDRVVRNSYSALMLLLIIMSGSRTAWIITIIYLLGVGAFSLFLRLRQADKLAIVMLSILLLTPSLAFVFTNMDSFLSVFGRDSTLSGRTIIWSVLSLSVLKQPLLGYGYQAFWSPRSGEATNAFMGIYMTMHFLATYAHSGYFEVLLDNGIVALADIVLLIVISIQRSVLLTLRGVNYFTTWCVMVVILNVIFNVDEVLFMLPYYLPWVLFLLAYVSLQSKWSSVSNPAMCA